MKKRLTVLIQLFLLPAALTGGYFWGAQPAAPPEFHDLRINPIHDYVSLIAPEDLAVQELAANFRSYEEAYRFVNEKIAFVPFAPPGPVNKTLEYKAGSCLGKAVLLCSLYRAMGMPAEDARIVMGIVMTPQGQADHVWLDLEHQGSCLQQDPSGLLGQFDFHEFPGTRYVDSYVVKETFCFNEEGAAIVSQLNRFRDSSMR